MVRLFIIADDFTGALDTGVQLAAAGARARVVTDPAADLARLAADAFGEGTEVLVLDTESRHLPAQEAFARVQSAARQAAALGVPYIYKKTDSALRGNVGAELAGLLDGSGQNQLAFVPAFPGMGRVTRGGVQYVGGVPVAESVFGADPFEPVTRSNVADIIGLQSSLPVVLRVPGQAPAGSGITVYDAESDEDMARIGRNLQETWQGSRPDAGRTAGEADPGADRDAQRNPGPILLAGCAGFGALLPRLLGLGTGTAAPLPALDARLLVVCGSVNPITLAQLKAGEENGFVRRRLTPEQKLAPGWWESEAGQRDIRTFERMLQEHPFRIIDTNDPEDSHATAEFAARQGLSLEQVRVGIAASLGRLVRDLAASPDLGTLMITGGDTLLQCMDALGVREMEPLGQLAPGVVLSRFAYQGSERFVISKSGGFGEPDLLKDLTRKLADTQAQPSGPAGRYGTRAEHAAGQENRP